MVYCLSFSFVSKTKSLKAAREKKIYIFLLKLTILQAGRLVFSCLDIMFKERKLGFSIIIIITWYVNISNYQRRLHSLFSMSQMLFRVFLPVCHSPAKLDLWMVTALGWSPYTRFHSIRKQAASSLHEGQWWTGVEQMENPHAKQQFKISELQIWGRLLNQGYTYQAVHVAT